MPAESSYAASHRGLRYIIAQFATLAGSVDYDDPTQIARLQALGSDMNFLLGHHLQTENTHLLGLLDTRLPGASADDRHDHEVLEQIQGGLADRLAAFDGKQTEAEGYAFYLDFTDFQGRYLAHISREERVTDALLMEHFTEEELRENSARIMAEVEFPVLLMSLRYICPAQSDRDNLAMLRTFQRVAPPEALQAVLDTIRPALGEARAAGLLAQL